MTNALNGLQNVNLSDALNIARYYSEVKYYSKVFFTQIVLIVLVRKFTGRVLNEAPEIYKAADRFIEIADWITLQLTGEEKRNSCTSGYKGFWHKQKGFPSKEFFKALDPRLENLVEEKLSTDIYPIGSKAGELTEIQILTTTS